MSNADYSKAEIDEIHAAAVKAAKSQRENLRKMKKHLDAAQGIWCNLPPEQKDAINAYHIPSGCLGMGVATATDAIDDIVTLLKVS